MGGSTSDDIPHLSSTLASSSTPVPSQVQTHASPATSTPSLNPTLTLSGALFTNGSIPVPLPMASNLSIPMKPRNINDFHEQKVHPAQLQFQQQQRQL